MHQSVFGDNNEVDAKESLLVRSSQTIYDAASGKTPAGEGSIRLPFEFKIPEDALPSFKTATPVLQESSAEIKYLVKAVGSRRGKLHRDPQAEVEILITALDRDVLPVRSVLEKGWSGKWKTLPVDGKIKKNLLGKACAVSMEVSVVSTQCGTLD